MNRKFQQCTHFKKIKKSFNGTIKHYTKPVGMLTKEFQDAKKSRFAQNSTETMPFRKIRINKSGKCSLFYSAIDLCQKSSYHPKLYFVSLPFPLLEKKFVLESTNEIFDLSVH